MIKFTKKLIVCEINTIIILKNRLIALFKHIGWEIKKDFCFCLIKPLVWQYLPHTRWIYNYIPQFCHIAILACKGRFVAYIVHFPISVRQPLFFSSDNCSSVFQLFFKLCLQKFFYPECCCKWYYFFRFSFSSFTFHFFVRSCR